MRIASPPAATVSWRSRGETGRLVSDESGVSMVEFTIALPLLLFLLFAIFDLSMVVARKVVLVRSLESAALAGAKQLSNNCVSGAQSKFAWELGRSPLLSTTQTVLATPEILCLDSAATKSTPVGGKCAGGQTKILNLNVASRIPCAFFCSLVLNDRGQRMLPTLSRDGARDSFNYALSLDIPIENENEC